MAYLQEHPVKQPIKLVSVFATIDGSLHHEVGVDGVTRIEACEKNGMYSNIPYIRVWAGDHCVAEYCQHNIVGVYFAKEAV